MPLFDYTSAFSLFLVICKPLFDLCPTRCLSLILKNKMFTNKTIHRHHIPFHLHISVNCHHIPFHHQISFNRHHIPFYHQISVNCHHIPFHHQISFNRHHIPFHDQHPLFLSIPPSKNHPSITSQPVHIAIHSYNPHSQTKLEPYENISLFQCVMFVLLCGVICNVLSCCGCIVLWHDLYCFI